MIFLYSLVFLLIVILGVIAVALRKKSNEYISIMSTKNAVAWCCTISNDIFRRNMTLRNVIKNAQIELTIMDECQIAGDEEWETVEKIIKGFQIETVQDYFCDLIVLPTVKNSTHLNKVYFMYLLLRYIEKHEMDQLFLGNYMFARTIDRKDYGRWGAQLYDATYELSDFAIALQKLHYICYMYCKRSIVIDQEKAGWDDYHSIEETIKSRVVSLMRI